MTEQPERAAISYLVVMYCENLSQIAEDHVSVCYFPVKYANIQSDCPNTLGARTRAKIRIKFDIVRNECDL